MSKRQERESQQDEEDLPPLAASSKDIPACEHCRGSGLSGGGRQSGGLSIPPGPCPECEGTGHLLPERSTYFCPRCGIRFDPSGLPAFDARVILKYYISKSGRPFADYRRVSAAIMPFHGKVLCQICLGHLMTAHEWASEPPAPCPSCGMVIEIAGESGGQTFFDCPKCHKRFAPPPPILEV